jgi:hypothetical protein
MSQNSQWPDQWPEKQEFTRWWRDYGSGINIQTGDDIATHTAKVAETAWCAAMEQKRATAVYELALRKACEGQAAQTMQEYIEWAESEIPKSKPVSQDNGHDLLIDRILSEGVRQFVDKFCIERIRILSRIALGNEPKYLDTLFDDTADFR